MNYPEELTNTYDIYEQIGAGGGGTVYRAVHRRLQKTVVLKRITGKATNIQECRTEVDILKNLHHPYLPQVLDFIESPEGIYTVMDFIPGKSLRQMIDEGHSFTEKEVLKYTRQLCEALHYLHSQNPPIIHGDIKPDNIMITPEDNVCLIDFNISGILEGKGALAFGYTPGFSSPEQVEGFEEARRHMAGQTTVQTTLQTIPDDSRTTFLPREEIESKKGQPSPDENETVLLIQDESNLAQSSPDENETVLLRQDESRAVQSFADENVTEVLAPEDDRMEQLYPSEKVGRGEAFSTSMVPQTAARTGFMIDKRSDVFSLGATIYTLLTGKQLDVKAPAVELPDVSDGFYIIISRTLERNPDKRYQNAGEMLQAVVQVHRKNRRYRQLLRRQQLIFAALVLLTAVGVFFVVEGRRVMKLERRVDYYALVDQMEEGINSAMAQEEFEKLYEKAVKIYPSYFEAYYEKTYYLFRTGDYDAVIRYIESFKDMPLESSSEMQGNLYHLYGECYFRLEDYPQAVNCYQTSLTYREDNPSVYRDYAISLVYMDRIEEATQILERAVAAGMDQVDVYMARGELARMTGNYDEALECFESVIEGAEDEYLLQRAYVMGSRTNSDMGAVEDLKRDAEWLQEGVTRLSMKSRLLLYERLAQDYITLGEMTQEGEYYTSAIQVFLQIKEMGWDTYLTYSNVVILYQRLGDLELAQEWALEMRDKYPTNYVSYIRLAFLEVEKQNQKPNDDRDYTTFNAYYQTAKEYYEQQMSGNITDAEMLLLSNTWQQMVDGGWLD